MYYTYVLQSLKDYKLYIGFTDNLRKRFWEHQTGKVTATKNRRPLKLVYYEACLDKKSAIKREKYFKTGFGRRYLKERLRLLKLPEILDD
ncbi:GIY-YIG nuclease family protein [Candidatus Falkowbacteria bacterium]|nr:GIY-YIG nuclease family protein [Candidatus Falkowbacteria bacterium]